MEQRWGGTGDWRRLAPYPVPREASPTDSIGIWLERWQLPDGVVELRRVSASETRVAHIDPHNCAPILSTHRRTFDSASMVTAFTDERLRDEIRAHDRGIIYVWSPRMPLSVRGLYEAEAAARQLRVAFTAVVADAEPEETAASGVSSRYWRSMDAIELVYRNATIHYPSALFYKEGSIVGTAIPGFKRRDMYVSLARERFAAIGAPRVSSGNAPVFWVDRSAQVTTVASIETRRRVGFFFKPVGATDLISYTAANAAYLFDIRTGEERRIPGTVDPVPSPDGRFITRPGLMWYAVNALTAGDTTPLFLDRTLPDEYQTLAILSKSRDAVRYRVVTGWRMGIRYRDYDVSLKPDGSVKQITPVGQASVPCDDRSFSLPISAKGSTEFGGFDTRSETNRIMQVQADGRCVDQLDLGFATGKLAFSYDGGAVAFSSSRINIDADGPLLKPNETFFKDALVLYRKTGRLVSLSNNRSLRASSFPEFLPNGRSIILDQASKARTVEVFRIVEIR